MFTRYNGVKVTRIEGLCILLKRYSYPNWYLDLIPKFCRPVPQLCMIANHVTNFIYERWHHLLTSFNQPWPSPANLKRYANYIHQSGAPIEYCWGFMDGTVRSVCRPGERQRQLCNGHKRVHGIKFSSIVCPDGMIANLHGRIKGRRDDSFMITRSGILDQLEHFSFWPHREILCVYGDPDCPLRGQLQTPFRGANLNPFQISWNKQMSRARVSVEWVFGDVINYFQLLHFRKNIKIILSAVGKMDIVCALLHNARSRFYGTSTENYLGLQPPLIGEYFL